MMKEIKKKNSKDTVRKRKTRLKLKNGFLAVRNSNMEIVESPEKINHQIVFFVRGITMELNIQPTLPYKSGIVFLVHVPEEKKLIS